MSNSYISQCCNEKAKKPALVKPPKDKEQDRGLGHWHCSKCGKPCKVTIIIDKSAEK